jgi:hypothetical protein
LILLVGKSLQPADIADPHQLKDPSISGCPNRHDTYLTRSFGSLPAYRVPIAKIARIASEVFLRSKKMLHI